MAEVTVRPLAPDDVHDAVAAILDGAHAPEDERPDDPVPYLAAAAETRRRGGEVLVGLLDGRVVGVCQLLIFQHFHHAGGWCAELEAVFVAESARGHGVGAALVRAAEDLARERGCYRLQLTSNNVRVDAHRFYLREGFEQSHRGFKKSLNLA